MLERTHPDPVLRAAVLEELQRRTKFKDVVLRALGLQERSVDREGDCPISANLPLFPRALRLLQAAFCCLSGCAPARCSSQVRTADS
jgi:hypothetical protein